MAIDYTIVKPISGGGLGDCKVGIVEITGEYVSGGVDIGLKEQPIFMTADGGFNASFAEGKVVLKEGDTEASGTIEGVKVLFIIKGSY